MPNGTLKLYNKLDNTLLVSLDILGTFNIEDNLNDTPSNMKVKVITSNVYREEFQVNTIAYHEDTNSWWVIKSDESSYITTGEYEHEIQLIELLEFYAYRHLPNCAFAPNTYTLEQMLLRLFDIAKLSITVVYPNFLDKDKIMPFFSFENFTVANAIKNISRSINAIPKMSINLSGFVPTLTFINRNGADNAIVNVLDTQFPIAYEKNMNSNDQFTTRSVSNITNAKSSALVIAPKEGGFKNISPNSISYEESNSRVFLPSKIDKIDWIRIYPKIQVFRRNQSTGSSSVIYDGYYFDSEIVKQAIISKLADFSIYVLADLQAIVMPNPETVAQINYDDVLGTSYPTTFFRGLHTLKNKFEYDTANAILGGDYNSIQKVQNKTIHWLPNTNEVVMSKSFREGMLDLQIPRHYRNIQLSSKTVGAVTEIISMGLITRTVGFFNNRVPIDETLIQVGYYPIADIKVSIDNDNDAQDEKFFNQSGKVIDAVSVSKLITSHTNDSVEGTKIRNARYDKFPYQLFTGTFTITVGSPPSSPSNGDYWFTTNTNQLYQRISGSWVLLTSTFGTTTPVDGNQSSLRFVNTATQQLFISQLSILPLGQLVLDNNQLYVITQRSIDGMVKNNNEFYNVIFTLSRNRIARSENIVADSAVISYKTPDDNLVFRNQLYKDYIELSLVNRNQDIPYLNMQKVLTLSSSLAGADFNYTVLAKNDFGTTPTIVRYVKNPTIFDLHKAKLMGVDWQSNNLLDYRLDSVSFSLTYVQTPILYTDNLGKATNFELLFLNTNDIINARTFYNSNFTPTSDIIPFADLTNVVNNFYTNSVINQSNFSIRIKEDNLGGKPYQKDPFEIPVFEYMIQGNDDYSNLGNIVIGNDLFSTFTGNIRYHYTINNTTRFTAENANKQYIPPLSTTRRVTFDRNSGTPHIVDLDLFQTFGGARNAVPITNIGIYATDGTTVKFLFAINDYVENATTTPANDKSNIRVYINNWKI
jgi:hypothetical protein